MAIWPNSFSIDLDFEIDFAMAMSVGENLLNQLFDSCSRPKRREQPHIGPI